MKLAHQVWTADDGAGLATPAWSQTAQLVLVFGSRALLEQAERRTAVRTAYPNALIFGCSTAGNISSTQISDDSLVITAVEFDHVTVRGARIRINEAKDSQDAGKQLAAALDPAGLVHVFVVSDGLQVNGSELVQGLSQALPPQVTLTGGLSGDGSNFQQTCVLWNGAAESGIVAAVGFYGSALKVGFGSLGGWEPFGPERMITRSQGNVLYELDDKNALDLYKRYLGEHAAGLPATALHFPLAVRDPKTDTAVVRTILAVNEAEGSMTFAGNVPEGCHARLMKSNVTRLVEGAVAAAKAGQTVLGSSPAQLALLVSCVGRRLVLKQRTEEELEGVRSVLGLETMLAGFYSYGEISPLNPSTRCELHNETMTITLLSEK